MKSNSQNTEQSLAKLSFKNEQSNFKQKTIGASEAAFEGKSLCHKFVI